MAKPFGHRLAVWVSEPLAAADAADARAREDLLLGHSQTVSERIDGAPAAYRLYRILYKFSGRTLSSRRHRFTLVIQPFASLLDSLGLRPLL